MSLLTSKEINEFDKVSSISISGFHAIFQITSIAFMLISALLIILLLLYQNADGQISTMTMIFCIAGTVAIVCFYTALLAF